MNATAVRRWLKRVGLLLLLAPLAGLGYLYLTYIDESHYSGTLYGFTIGMAREQVFDAASRSEHRDSLYVSYAFNGYGAEPFHRLRFVRSELEPLLKRDYWSFYLEDSAFNSIKLRFRSDRLYEIHRHRQRFELP
jgi:hypothetical protein